jgi:hypothetical protein
MWIFMLYFIMPGFYLLWCGYEGHKWRAAMVGVPLLSMTVMIVLENTLWH